MQKTGEVWSLNQPRLVWRLVGNLSNPIPCLLVQTPGSNKPARRFRNTPKIESHCHRGLLEGEEGGVGVKTAASKVKWARKTLCKTPQKGERSEQLSLNSVALP